MIFYFSLLHGVHCTPVACYYTTDISTHHSLEASGKMQKVLFLLKRVYKVHKISDVSSFNLRKSKWYPGMSSWRVISSVGFEENQDYENLPICNMRTSFQRHKFLVYLKDEMNYVLLYCLEDYSFVTLIIMCTARIGRREIQGRYDNILKGGKFLNFEVGKGRFQKIKLMKKFWGDRIRQRLIWDMLPIFVTFC